MNPEAHIALLWIVVLVLWIKVFWFTAPFPIPLRCRLVHHAWGQSTFDGRTQVWTCTRCGAEDRQ